MIKEAYYYVDSVHFTLSLLGNKKKTIRVCNFQTKKSLVKSFY